MTENNLALAVRGLTVEFHTPEGTVQAINDLSIEIDNGKTLGLVGETGAGKTTTALAVMRLIQMPPGVIKAGEVLLHGENVLNKSQKEMEKIRGKEVSMIFQDPMTALNPVMAVEDQIAEVIVHHDRLRERDALKRAHEMLEMVGIPRERGREYPHQFSGGMKQRVVIAIALSCNPRLLIADEPTTALDVTIQAQVLDMMVRLRKEHGTSMLMITHDLGIVAEVCDMVAVIYAGHVIEYGNLEDIFENTRHPYTRGLFDSLPNLAERHQKLKPIPGLMADSRNLPAGCAFSPRCRFATDKCREEKPPRTYRNKHHYVECHLYNESNIGEAVIDHA